MQHVVEQPGAADHVGPVVDVLRRLRVDLRLGLVPPRLRLHEALFGLPHGAGELVDLGPVVRTEPPPQVVDLALDRIENGLAILQPLKLLPLLLRLAFQEEPGEDA